VFSEAQTYYPIKAEFNRQKKKKPENIPEFLTTSIYNIVTTQSLSSSTMQGYPLLMVAFPTFNQKELFALINELSPKTTILVEGKPHDSDNSWRFQAVKWLNGRMNEYVLKRYAASTFDYKETLEKLEIIYDDFRYSHKVVIAPTGSKLQTFAVFIFKQMHPDIQLVYPVTKKFAQEYTQGARASWQITIPDLSRLTHDLSQFRKKGLSDLEILIKSQSH
jgi:hypothetical protein